MRSRIINGLKERLEREPVVLAAWLEGADAHGRVDEFSDIDFCCAVEENGLERAGELAREALSAMGELDLAHGLVRSQKQQHTTFHLAGTSPYLLIDFVAYLGSAGSRFIFGDDIEKPLILFDRGNCVQFHPREPEMARRDRCAQLRDLRDTLAQAARLEKYLRRGEFLEAFGYYHKWLLEPLIKCLRLKHTPLHLDYYIVHISRHLPAEDLKRLEGLFKIHSLQEMEAKMGEAIRFFEETASEIETMQGESRSPGSTLIS